MKIDMKGLRQSKCVKKINAEKCVDNNVFELLEPMELENSGKFRGWPVGLGGFQTFFLNLFCFQGSTKFY